MVWLLIGIILSHIFILSKLAFFPYPELFVYPYLTVKGLVPYTQILDQHFPGLMFLPVNLYSLGMTNVNAARYWQWGIVAITHILIYLCFNKLVKSPKKALLANILYLMWQPFFEGYVLWIDSFVPIFLLLGFLFFDFENKKIKNFVLSGLFVGIAFVFKQVTFPLGFIVGLFTLYKFGFKSACAYACGILIPVVLLVVYINSIGAWNDFVFWTYKFNVTGFAQLGRKYPEVRSFLKAGLFYFPTVLAGMYFSVKKNWSGILATLFMLFGFAFAYARFDYVHLQPSLVFGCLILALFINHFKSKFQFKAVLVLWLLICSFVLFKFYKTNLTQKVYFSGTMETKLAAEVSKYAKDNESVFAMATTPHIYYLNNTLPSGKLFVFQFPWFMLEAEPRVLAGIKSDPPKVILRDPNSTTDGMNLVSYMKDIDKYIMDNYKKVNEIDGIEVYIQK